MAVRALRMCTGGLSIILLLLQIPVAAVSNELSSPKVTLKNVALASLNFNTANIIIDLDVHNPNHTEIVVEAIRYRLSLNQIDVKQGVIRQEEHFSANSERGVRVPVALAYDEHLPGILAALSSPASPSYEISGTVKIRNNVGLFPFHHNGQLISTSTKNIE
jgi:LEA14-like dessication related protein